MKLLNCLVLGAVSGCFGLSQAALGYLGLSQCVCLSQSCLRVSQAVWDFLELSQAVWGFLEAVSGLSGLSRDFLGTVLGSMGVFLACLEAVAGFLDLSGSSWRLSQACLQLSQTCLQFYGRCLELSLPLWGCCGLLGAV